MWNPKKQTNTCRIAVTFVCIGEELTQLFRDAPTTELPLSMLSSNEGGLTAAELAVKIGAANSQCKNFFVSTAP